MGYAYMNDEIFVNDFSNTNDDPAREPHRPYHLPHLEDLGDLRGITLGGTPGVGDSSGSFTRKPFVGGSPPFFEDPSIPFLPGVKKLP